MWSPFFHQRNGQMQQQSAGKHTKGDCFTEPLPAGERCKQCQQQLSTLAENGFASQPGCRAFTGPATVNTDSWNAQRGKSMNMDLKLSLNILQWSHYHGRNCFSTVTFVGWCYSSIPEDCRRFSNRGSRSVVHCWGRLHPIQRHNPCSPGGSPQLENLQVGFNSCLSHILVIRERRTCHIL